MRRVLIRPWQKLAVCSLWGMSLIAGCGGGADTAAPVANNPGAVPGAPAAATPNPQAMMAAQHGAPTPPGMVTPPGMNAVPGAGAGATPQAGHATDPAQAMQNSLAGNPAAAHGSPTPPGVTPATAAPAVGNPAAAHGSPTPPGAGAAALPEATAAAAHGAPTPPGFVPGANPAATPAAAHGAPTPPGNPNPAEAVAGAGATNPAEAMANNLAGANPGAANPGAPDGQGGQGGVNAITGEPGSIEYAISKLIVMAKAGDYTGVETVISEKAKGLAAEFREQDLKPTQIENYKTVFDGMQGINRRAVGGNGVQFTFRKGETTIQFVLAKETGGVFRIKELQIRDGKVR